MPSPFPGMDPYLEGAEWTSVHTELSSEISRQLAPKLSPRYIVRATRRFVAEEPEDVAITPSDLYPDVSVLDSQRHRTIAERAVAIAPEPLQLATFIPARIPQVRLEIRDVAKRQLITAIEVLSPSNKRGKGYEEYLAKRRTILFSTTHLIEIDLLRKGQRVPMLKPLPPALYFVFVGRAERRPIVDVWPIQLPMRLPEIPVPLLPGDPDVALDLQLALHTIYDALRYDLTIDYTRPPDVPLEGEAAAWANEHLRTVSISN